MYPQTARSCQIVNRSVDQLEVLTQLPLNNIHGARDGIFTVKADLISAAHDVYSWTKAGRDGNDI